MIDGWIDRPARAGIALLAGLALALLLISAGSFAASAQAHEGIVSFQALASTSQAGGHPDIELHAVFNNHAFYNGEFVTPEPETGFEDAKTVNTHFPAGFIGDPHSVPACTLKDFNSKNCPPETQIGIANVPLAYVPVYNMETHPNEAGLIAFADALANSKVFISLSARTGSDYGLDAKTTPIFHLIPVGTIDLWIWGVPADPVHDEYRFPIGEPKCILHVYPGMPCYAPVESTIPPKPYLQNPTTCAEPLNVGLEIEYYDHNIFTTENPWPATTGCDQLSFNPSLTAKPTTEQADTASGLDVDLSVPQPLNPTVPSPSELRSTTVTLPEGFSINPNAADGKTACTDQEAAFGTENAANCPETSKVGTLQLDSSALPAPIDGAIYLGVPLPEERYRLFLTADGFGTHVKLSGIADPAKSTGQLVVTFPDLPQAPFQDFNMHFFGSERGLLATPTACGSYPVKAHFVPWDTSLADQESTASFAISAGPNGRECPPAVRPFAPRFQAGAPDNTAGVHTPLSVEVGRDDGDQNLVSLQVTTPPGFAATLRGIPYCPESALAKLGETSYSGLVEQASPSCPAASQIGTAVTGTGAGTHPLYTPGKVYLAGPYRGAPLSLEVVVPAVSGPYDLGNVVVRAAINVDPATAQVSTSSDPIPQILDGIPLRLRSIRVNLDRPGFTLNPTNCAPGAVAATVSGNQGASVSVGTHYQVANCANLPFAPKLAVRLTGSAERLGHPALTATLTAAGGESNLSGAVVTLPNTAQLDNDHIGTVCTRVKFASDSCPADSVYGSAVATTPLLDQPLEGPVYLRSSSHGLPDLVADLKGQIEIELAGRIDTANGGLRASFESVPDAPVSNFVLKMLGGRKGLLVSTTNLCRTHGKARVALLGQNGDRVNRNTKLRVACGGNPRHRRHHKRHGIRRGEGN